MGESDLREHASAACGYGIGVETEDLAQLHRGGKTYAQHMEDQDDQPSEYPTDGTDEYGEQVNRYVVGKNQVGQEEENQPNDPIDDELPQKTPAPRQQEQDDYYHQYEYDYLHQPSFYTRHRRLKTQHV
jgi:hypothetical protein